MKALEDLEDRFFTEGPKFCLKGAAALIFAGLALSTVGVALSPEEPWYAQFRFAGLMAIPSILFLALAWALTRRHIATIPLVLALAYFFASYILVPPPAAFEGINTSPFTVIVGWGIYFAGFVACAFAAYFMWHLWRKGAFRAPSDH